MAARVAQHYLGLELRRMIQDKIEESYFMHVSHIASKLPRDHEIAIFTSTRL
jgi:hypothetical protein